MVPAVALALPLFLILRSVGWLDTDRGLILTYTAFDLPLVLWLLAGFFEKVPISLDRAARIDGCSRLGVLVRIILPLSGSALVAAGALAFILAWTDLFLALVLTSGSSITLPVRTALFEGIYTLDWRSAATAGVITAVPVLFLALGCQRWIIRGITEGAVQG
jgi:multiple sugar transport system permease protein